MRAQSRSEWAAVTAAACAPVILWCTGTGWQWVLFGGAAAAMVWLAALRRTRPDRTLAERTADAFGKAGGNGIRLAQTLSLIAVAAIALRRSGQVLPNLDSAYPWVPLVLIVLAYAAAVQGNVCVNRCAAVLFWLPVLSALLILLFALPEMQTRWMRPVWTDPAGGWERSLAALAVFLLPVLSLLHGAPPGGRWGKLWPAVLAVFGTFSAFVCAACLSPMLAGTEKVAFFTMAASEHLLGAASRFDALLSAAAIVALFCFLAKLLAAVAVLMGPAQKRPKLIVFCLLSFAASAVRSSVLDVAAVGSVLLFWGVAPLAALYLPTRKKYKKSKENA